MLQLTYQGDTAIPVEVEGILPETVRELSLDAIRSLEIFHGNRQKQLGDFFSVEGDPSDCNWNMSGDLSGVHWIGTEMREGHIHIEGNAGRHLGSEMRGGLISCDGDVGDWAGGEMRGGRLQIRGNAGHLLGAAYRGSRRGMRGGTIIVQGNAGNEVGHTMRRGSILVGGKAGDMIGFNMLAGTLFRLRRVRHSPWRWYETGYTRFVCCRSGSLAPDVSVWLSLRATLPAADESVA